MSFQRWQRQSTCVWRVQLHVRSDGCRKALESIWISHPERVIPSLKSLISVSGRVTGNLSLCHVAPSLLFVFSIFKSDTGLSCFSLVEQLKVDSKWKIEILCRTQIKFYEVIEKNGTKTCSVYTILYTVHWEYMNWEKQIELYQTDLPSLQDQ